MKVASIPIFEKNRKQFRFEKYTEVRPIHSGRAKAIESLKERRDRREWYTFSRRIRLDTPVGAQVYGGRSIRQVKRDSPPCYKVLSGAWRELVGLVALLESGK